MPGCQEKEDVQKAITRLRTQLQDVGGDEPWDWAVREQESKETGGTRVELRTRKFRTWGSSLVGRVLT